MTEPLHNDQGLTTADIAGRPRPAEAESSDPVLGGPPTAWTPPAPEPSAAPRTEQPASPDDRPDVGDRVEASRDRAEAEAGPKRAEPAPKTDGPRAAPADRNGGSSPLFAGDETQELRSHWDDIQTGFVDEPRKAVEQADALVASTMKRLADVFAQERSNLEAQWSRGGDVSTEDLRVAFQRYRSFFTRLLSV